MSFEWNLNGDHPQVSRKAYVHPTAVLIGNVHVGDDAFIGPYAVIRADELGPDGSVAPIMVGEGTNVQDGVIIHALGGTGVDIGSGTSIAHAAVVHGPCRIGERCFVGFGSVVYGSELGSGVTVMHRCLVEETVVPPGCLVPSGACIRGPDDTRGLSVAGPDVQRFVERVRDTNIRLAQERLRERTGGRSRCE